MLVGIHIKESKKRGMQDEELGAVRVKTTAWMKERFVTYYKNEFAPDALVSTMVVPKMLQREVKKEHVKKLFTSFYDSKTKPRDVIFAVPMATADIKKFVSAKKINIMTKRWICGGQHSAVALKQLMEVHGGADDGLWQQRLPVSFIAYDPDSQEDVDCLAGAVKALNVGHSVILKDDYMDDLMKTRSHMLGLVAEEGIDFVDGYTLPLKMQVEIKKRMGRKPTRVLDLWRVAALPSDIYEKLIPYFKGDCYIKSKGQNKKIKAPLSGSHFAVITNIDYNTLHIFVDKLVEGTWTGQVFLSMCKLWKKTICMRLAVLKHMETTETMPPKAVKEWDLMIDDMLEGNKTDDNAYTFYDVGEVWEALVGEFPDFGKEELIKPYAAAMSGHDITKLHEVPNALRDRVDALLSQKQVCVVFWMLLALYMSFHCGLHNRRPVSKSRTTMLSASQRSSASAR